VTYEVLAHDGTPSDAHFRRRRQHYRFPRSRGCEGEGRYDRGLLARASYLAGAPHGCTLGGSTVSLVVSAFRTYRRLIQIPSSLTLLKLSSRTDMASRF
jgi:hypothetical protein